jgi:hypothetical protein
MTIDDAARTPAIERIARVLAGRDASANADGVEASAATTVDENWPLYRGDAVSILKALREPDDVMAAIGDTSLWTRMVEAALAVETEKVAKPDPASEPPEIGSAPLIEGP